MPKRPLVGLPGRRHHGRQISDFPAVLADTAIDSYLVDNTRSVIAAGGLPVHLPIDADPAELVEHLDGVLLTGGADVHPEHYGRQALETDTVEPERDAFEFGLATAAIDGGVPVLGICRGLQVLNVLGGGTLHPHLPHHSRLDLAIHTLVHDVDFVPGSRLASLFGKQARVNSLHHQAVDRPAAGWTVTATADDGTIEGIELDGHDVIAVQWHPEMLPTNIDDPLFSWFVERAAEHAARRGSASRPSESV